MRVGRADRVVAGKGRHQHQQRRLGQVEIGDQAGDRLEGVAGRDEERGVGAAGLPARRPARPTPARAGWWCRRRPRRGRPRWLRAPRRRSPAPMVYHSLCIWCSVEVFDAHRLEGAGADMQRDVGEAARPSAAGAPAAAGRNAGRRSARRPRPAPWHTRSGSAARRMSSAACSIYGGSGSRPCASIRLEHVVGEMQREELAGALADDDVEGVGQADALARHAATWTRAPGPARCGCRAPARPALPPCRRFP